MIGISAIVKLGDEKFTSTQWLVDTEFDTVDMDVDNFVSINVIRVDDEANPVPGVGNAITRSFTLEADSLASEEE